MGLDWDLMRKAHDGREGEFAELYRKYVACDDSEENKALVEQLVAISEPPYRQLGAPRVGFVKAADEWLYERVKENNPELTAGLIDKLLGRDPLRKEFERVRGEMEGYCVLALLPDCDGFPVYTHHGTFEGLERYSFRAKFLDDVQAQLGKELYEQAWVDMLPEELGAYGLKVMEIGQRYAKLNGVEKEAERKEPPEADFRTPESRAHILQSAGRWCLYWSGRGFGMRADY